MAFPISAECRLLEKILDAGYSVLGAGYLPAGCVVGWVLEVGWLVPGCIPCALCLEPNASVTRYSPR